MTRARSALRIPSASLLLISTLALAGCGIGSTHLRPEGGPLAGCDGGPHCVSSLSKDEDRKTAPLSYVGSREDARKRLLAVLAATPRLKLVTSTPDYVHAEVSTSIMHYVDDVEFLFEPNKPLIDVRSSSRIGYYDFHANREHVEDIRTRFRAK